MLGSVTPTYQRLESGLSKVTVSLKPSVYSIKRTYLVSSVLVGSTEIVLTPAPFLIWNVVFVSSSSSSVMVMVMFPKRSGSVAVIDLMPVPSFPLGMVINSP